MKTRGAEFGKVAPIESNALLRVGGATATRRINLGVSGDLENGTIIQVSPEGAFRPGQQILFYLTVYNGPVSEDPETPGYISRVRLKPWFKRVSLEQRGPGDPGNNPSLVSVPTTSGNAGNGWISPDEQQFGSGPIISADPTSSLHAANNRLVWFPVPKLLDITQYQVPPPPVAPDRHSDSLFLDDVWTLDLQDPSDAAYLATQGDTQPNFGRSSAFLYISHGTALGLTQEFEVTGDVVSPPSLFIDLTWVVGTTE